MAGVAGFEGWVPAHIDAGGSDLAVEWCHVGAARFQSPFLRDDIERALRLPFNQAFRRRTPLAALGDLARERPGIPPTAFVFHASRCGSTLLTQMLSALDSHVVLSEPETLDFILHGHPLLPLATPAARAEQFRSLVSALGQPRAGGETRLVIKLDPLNIAAFPIVRGAFPGTPWLFVYRDPVEIAVSQLREPAARLLPATLGPASLLVPPQEAWALSHEEFVARVIGGILALGAHHCEASGGVPVNYTELPAATWGRLAALLGVDGDTGRLARMQALLGRDAKRPDRAFTPDSESKRALASPALRAAIEAHALPHYRRLEAMRVAATPG